MSSEVIPLVVWLFDHLRPQLPQLVNHGVDDHILAVDLVDDAIGIRQ